MSPVFNISRVIQAVIDQKLNEKCDCEQTFIKNNFQSS